LRLSSSETFPQRARAHLHVFEITKEIRSR
jgi:hypothetical protein